jgi:hypothetical protein
MLTFEPYNITCCRVSSQKSKHRLLNTKPNSATQRLQSFDTGFSAYITWALNTSQLAQGTAAMTFRLFLACLALVFPIFAGSATWVEVGGNDSAVVLVDKDSLRRNQNKVKSWLKWQWVKPVEVPNAFPVKLYQLEQQLQISDCQNNTLAIAQGIRYADAFGNEVADSYAFEEKSWHFTEVAPETLGESIIKFVCKTAAKEKK